MSTPNLFCDEVVDDVISTPHQIETPNIPCFEVFNENTLKPKKKTKIPIKIEASGAISYLNAVDSYDHKTLSEILKNSAKKDRKSTLKDLKDTDENDEGMGDVSFDFETVTSEENIFNTYDKEGYLKSIADGGDKCELRKNAVNYLFGACKRHGMTSFTLSYAVSYIDKLLSCNDVFNPEWPKACLVLATKLVEPWDYKDKELSSKLGLSINDMWEMALQVLTLFNGQAYPLTPYTFLHHYCQLVNISVDVALIKSDLAILSSLRDTDLMHFKPWEIALSIILLVNGSSDDEEKFKSIDDKVLFNRTDKDKVMKWVSLIKTNPRSCLN